jgi:hypothetical protein
LRTDSLYFSFDTLHTLAIQTNQYKGQAGCRNDKQKWTETITQLDINDNINDICNQYETG